MSFHVIRSVDQDDLDAIQKAAERFCKRHDIKVYSDAPILYWIDEWAENETYCMNKSERTYRTYLWEKCMCRALKVSYVKGINIAYGNVGFWKE